MKKEELKKILKPLIKECIKEVIFEDGTLSTVVSEVVKGLGNPLTESRPSPQVNQIFENNNSSQRTEQKKAKLQENKKRMLDAIGKDSYNGVNIFEGTTPTRAPTPSTQHGALKDVDPSDPGVDISKLSVSSNIWKKLAGN